MDKITYIEDGINTETKVACQSLLTDGFARRIGIWMVASSVAMSLRHGKVLAKGEGYYCCF